MLTRLFEERLMFTRLKALSNRRVISAVVVALVVIAIGIGMLRPTPVEAECHHGVRHKNDSSGGWCMIGHGPSRLTGC